MFWLFLYRTLVTGFFIAFLPVVVIVCLCVPKWREGIEHKLGLIDQETIYQIRKSRFNDLLGKLKEGDLDLPENKLSNNIWLHAVSFGEVKTVEPFVYELQKKYPDHTICLSTGTRTGQDLAKKLFTNIDTNSKLQKQCVVFYCPFDFYFAVKNWFTVIKPKMLIIAETEIWSELLCQARRNNVPAFLINARLTDKSVKKYSCLKPLMVEVMKCFKKICAQSESDKQRFISIGAKQEQTEVVGNLKFDSMQRSPEEEIDQLKEQLNLEEDTFTLIAGSTHKGEEELACKVYKKLKEELPDKDLRLIVAPRHLERISEVEKVCKDNELSYVKKSSMEEGLPSPIWRGEGAAESCGRGEALILDTLGELTKFYGVANVAMLGGTWAKVGGHNPLEPIAYGIPVIVGPYTFKIDDLILQLGERIMKSNEVELPELIKQFIGSTIPANDSIQKMQISKQILGSI